MSVSTLPTPDCARADCPHDAEDGRSCTVCRRWEVGPGVNYSKPLTTVAARERERCAALCEDLADRWRRSAKKLRKHTYMGGWLWRQVMVLPEYEKCAKALDSAAHGLETVAMAVRLGWDDPNRVSNLALYGVEVFGGATAPTATEEELNRFALGYSGPVPPDLLGGLLQRYEVRKRPEVG